MATVTDRPIRYPTREELDAAWDRSVERYGETNLEAVNDLMTIADGIANLRTRLAEADKLAAAVWDWSSLGPYPDHDAEVAAEERIIKAYFDYNGRRPPRSLEGDTDDRG